MQTILGSGGAIGLEMARILPEYTSNVRLVSRNPKRAIPSNELFPADLLKQDEVIRAVEGSDVVYLLVGLPYKIKVWREQWPVVMRNTIEACKTHGSKLVFFDNIYMYDRDHLSLMDENTPIRPTSKKGVVRAEVATMLTNAVEEGELEALIARSADFYGPGKQENSVLAQMVFNRLAADKSAQWIHSIDHKHSFTYTPDASRGTAILGNTDDAYGEVWHLPTASNPMTGKQWIEAIAREFGVETKVQIVTNFMMTMMGLFVPALKEVKEMNYQYDRDYEFLSDKFNKRFNFEPTRYLEGIKAVVEADYR